MKLNFHIWKYEKEMHVSPEGFWTHFRYCIICGERQYHYNFWNHSQWIKESF